MYRYQVMETVSVDGKEGELFNSNEYRTIPIPNAVFKTTHPFRESLEGRAYYVLIRYVN